MPTHEEQLELVENCYWVWTSNYNGSGVSGFIVYAAKSPSDKGHVVKDDTTTINYSVYDTQIFLPAAGRCREILNDNVGSGCGYWSSSFAETQSYNGNAWCMTGSLYYIGTANERRYRGLTIRAVCE